VQVVSHMSQDIADDDDEDLHRALEASLSDTGQIRRYVC